MATKKELENQEKLEAQKKKDLTTVRGIFKNYENPARELKFAFKKYKDVPDKEYTFVHNQHYEIPYMIADHLNSLGFKEHKWLQDESGKPSNDAGKFVNRFGFHSVDFGVD